MNTLTPWIFWCYFPYIIINCIVYFELDNDDIDDIDSTKRRSILISYLIDFSFLLFCLDEITYHYHFFLRCNPLVNGHIHLNASYLISPNVFETDVDVTSHAANEWAGAGFNLEYVQNQRNINRLGNQGLPKHVGDRQHARTLLTAYHYGSSL